MSSIATWLPLVAVLAPALATVGIVATRRNRALREATTFLGAGTAFAAVAGLAREVLAGFDNQVARKAVLSFLAERLTGLAEDEG